LCKGNIPQEFADNLGAIIQGVGFADQRLLAAVTQLIEHLDRMLEREK
jgi:hypothetical protein